MWEPSSAVHSHIPGLLQTGAYSDMALVCRGKEYPVHRVIVCPQSAVIERELRKTGNSKLEVQFQPRAFELMLEYMYSRDYAVESGGVYHNSAEDYPSSLSAFAFGYTSPAAAAGAGAPAEKVRLEERMGALSLAGSGTGSSGGTAGGAAAAAAGSSDERKHHPSWTHALAGAIAMRYGVGGLQALARERVAESFECGGWDHAGFHGLAAAVFADAEAERDGKTADEVLRHPSPSADALAARRRAAAASAAAAGAVEGDPKLWFLLGKISAKFRSPHHQPSTVEQGGAGAEGGGERRVVGGGRGMLSEEEESRAPKEYWAGFLEASAERISRTKGTLFQAKERWEREWGVGKKAEGTWEKDEKGKAKQGEGEKGGGQADAAFVMDYKSNLEALQDHHSYWHPDCWLSPKDQAPTGRE